MCKILLAALFCFPVVSSAKFINPMEFDGSEAQKSEVIEYIKERVNKDYCESELKMCQDTVLRMMERENLDAFKEASQAKNKKIMGQLRFGYVQLFNYQYDVQRKS